MKRKDENCLFCKIAAGEVPCKKLYEDANSIAFLDIYPTSKGHSLVVPKSHYATLLDIPEMELKEIMAAVQQVSAAVMRATKAEGFNIIQNNRQAAGQVINHLHFHIVPRSGGYGLKMSMGSRKAEEHELSEWEKSIKEQI